MARRRRPEPPPEPELTEAQAQLLRMAALTTIHPGARLQLDFDALVGHSLLEKTPHGYKATRRGKKWVDDHGG